MGIQLSGLVSHRHHVSRYCSKLRLDEAGHPLATAFELDSGETYLSVNWLEYFGEDISTDEQMKKIRETIGLTLRRSAKFAKLNVGRIKDAICTKIADGTIEVRHMPRGYNLSHAGIFGMVEHYLEIATILRDHLESLYPAIQ